MVDETPWTPSKETKMSTGITRAQRERGMRPVVDDGKLYLGDNGRCLCGAHLGNSARYTGRDISGQKVEELTIASAREAIRIYGWDPECETCGKKVQLIHDVG